VWGRFDAAFGFRPTTHEFPAITEPAASVTWSLRALADDPRRHKRDALVALTRAARCHRCAGEFGDAAQLDGTCGDELRWLDAG
jgi:hypothetical protein